MSQSALPKVNGHPSASVHPDFPSLPNHEDLPYLPSTSERHSWPIWNDLLGGSAEATDELGCLNLLTPSAKLAAAREVRTGQSVALNWIGEALHSGRRKRLHRILPLSEDGSEWTGNDDEVTFNTQGGSQWDGFSESAFLIVLMRRTLGTSGDQDVLWRSETR